MIRPELSEFVASLSEDDKADLTNFLLDDGLPDPNDSDQDSLTEAIRRSLEMEHGLVETLSLEEFRSQIQEERRKS